MITRCLGTILLSLMVLTDPISSKVVVRADPSDISTNTTATAAATSTEAVSTSTTTATATATSVLSPQATYDGGYPDAGGIRLRLANGGAGQSGLVGAWANAFIKDMVEKKGAAPFKVGWYLGDTFQSLNYLANGGVDVALTYNAASEQEAVDEGNASERKVAFYDHFMLVGPKENPANLSESDSIEKLFNKIVKAGNAASTVPPDPNGPPPTRFLSRFDKSATNIKDSELFIRVGQVPWAHTKSTWYLPFIAFPLEALSTASLLRQYTITDRGTWLTSPTTVTERLQVFKVGQDNLEDPLLNVASILLGTKRAEENTEISDAFMEWVTSDEGGRKVVREFAKNGEVLYTLPSQ